ncbi:6-bladed beta-propeller [Algoriphagus chordae]|uniref:6-bladed beta-propeller protein n=1 Tax=Algoriphagus chordae TaxID=237019 RepID=A0A2W7QKN4_9BACT|nr:6-bladed beta-propeller [Algoriphagus chordae]PZX48681.1 6-bladed beta-propeller protein [Algoriphagus chordae]
MRRLKIIIISIILYSCGELNNDKNLETRITVNTENPTTNNDEIFSSITLTPLETIDESLIIKINKLITHKQLYIILDEAQNSILIFNTEGKFLYKIAKEGQGPGEYGRISDIIINPHKEQLEILSPNGIVNIYSIKGEWIEDYEIPEFRSTHLMELVDPDIRAIYSKDSRLDNNLSLYSKSQNKIIFTAHTETSIFENISISLFRSPLKGSGDNLIFCTPFTNEIYKLSREGMSLIHSWDFGQYTPNFEEHSSLIQADENQIFDKFKNEVGKTFISFSNYEENEQYIFAHFMYKGGVQTIIFSKKLDRFVTLKSFPYGITEILDNTIQVVCDPEYIQTYVNNDSFTNNEIPTLRTISKNDNPIILKYKLKDSI